VGSSSTSPQSRWWVASVVAAAGCLALLVLNRPSNDEPQASNRVAAVALLPEQSTDSLPRGALGEASGVLDEAPVTSTTTTVPAAPAPDVVPVAAPAEGMGVPGELPATP
jgi:hypothetical protein